MEHRSLGGSDLIGGSVRFAGVLKMTQPLDVLTAGFVWPGDLPGWLVRFIGVSEFAGAVGLLLPALTRIRPSLTALAAAGLALVMLLAAFFHISRGGVFCAWNQPGIRSDGAMAVFVAWGRSKKAPIHPR